MRALLRTGRSALEVVALSLWLNRFSFEPVAQPVWPIALRPVKGNTGGGFNVAADGTSALQDAALSSGTAPQSCVAARRKRQKLAGEPPALLSVGSAAVEIVNWHSQLVKGPRNCHLIVA
jgi:hypothetical protein